jgi:hypothetical protein
MVRSKKEEILEAPGLKNDEDKEMYIQRCMMT